MWHLGFVPAKNRPFKELHSALAFRSSWCKKLDEGERKNGMPREIWPSPHLRDRNSIYWAGFFQQVCCCLQISLAGASLAARPPNPGSIPEPALVLLSFLVHFPSVLSPVTSVCCLYPSLTAALVLLDAPHRPLLLSYPSGRALKSTANGQIANSGMLTYKPHASLFHVQTRMQSSFGFGHLPVWWAC